MDQSEIFIMLSNIERSKQRLKIVNGEERINKLVSLLLYLYDHALLPSPDTVKEYVACIYTAIN